VPADTIAHPNFRISPETIEASIKSEAVKEEVEVS